MGVIFSDQGLHLKAINCYEQALVIDPDSFMAYSNLGVEYTDLGQYDKALTYHKKALSLNSFYSEGWYNLACFYAQQRDVEKALVALKRAIKLDSSNKDFAKEDPDLINLEDNEIFKQLID